MSKVTELATAQLSATDTLVIELVEANETPASRHHPVARQGLRTASPTLPRRRCHSRKAVR
jgi:hypothetical protein